MKNIELIIKIPEKDWEFIKSSDGCRWSRAIIEGVINGMPLPKGHGDLIDVNRKITISIYDEQDDEWGEETLTVLEFLNSWSNDGVTMKDVIIQADEEESGDNE